MLTSDDISAITNALRTQIDEIVTRQVQMAVSEIPWRTSKYIDEVLDREVVNRIKDAVREKVFVEVKIC